MKYTIEDKEKVNKYLYGELADADRDEFEDRLFGNEDLSLFLEDLENDLIDEYIRGELEFDEKRKFEKHYLTSESRHARVDLARNLNMNVFNKEKVTVSTTATNKGLLSSVTSFFGLSNPLLAGSLAVLLLAVLLGGLWIISQNRGAQNIASDNSNQTVNIPVKETEPEETSTPETSTPVEKEPEPDSNSISADERKPNDTDASPAPSPINLPEQPEKTPKPIKEKPTPKKEPKVRPKQPTVFAFSLTPPLRSSSNPVLSIPSNAKTVRLTLLDNFGRKYEKFSLDLNSVSGTKVWSSQVIASKRRPQKSIAISIPGESFKSGNYEIAVKGITKEGKVEEISFYNFSVRKK